VDVNYLDEIPFIVLWFWAKQPLRRILKIIFFSLCLIVLGLALPEFLFNLSPDVGTFWLFLIRARALFVFLIYFWGVWQMWKTDGVPKGLSEFYAAIK
jgi:hypothetical protein